MSGGRATAPVKKMNGRACRLGFFGPSGGIRLQTGTRLRIVSQVPPLGMPGTLTPGRRPAEPGPGGAIGPNVGRDRADSRVPWPSPEGTAGIFRRSSIDGTVDPITLSALG